MAAEEKPQQAFYETLPTFGQTSRNSRTAYGSNDSDTIFSVAIPGTLLGNAGFAS